MRLTPAEQRVFSMLEVARAPVPAEMLAIVSSKKPVPSAVRQMIARLRWKRPEYEFICHTGIGYSLRKQTPEEQAQYVEIRMIKRGRLLARMQRHKKMFGKQ